MSDLNINNFAQQSGLGDFGSPYALGELQKALSAGQNTGGSAVGQEIAGSGTPLKVESLDRQMKLLSFRDSDIRLWRLFPKMSVFNTANEWLQSASYGVERGGSYTEGALPKEEDSTYIRRVEKIKYYGVTRAVTHVMQLVNTAGIGDAIQRQVMEGTMWLLRKINRDLAHGSEAIVPTDINGVYRQHVLGITAETANPLTYYNSEFVVDLKGAILTQDFIQDASTTIFQSGFGQATHLFAPANVLSSFAKDYYSKQRIMLGGGASIAGGVNIDYPKTISASFGEIALEHDIFMNTNLAQQAVAAGATATTVDAPATPTSSTVTAPVADAASTQFGGTQAGDYKWAVRAKNSNGLSALLVLDATAVTIAGTESADLVFADGGGANPASGYVIYRTTKGATSNFFPILEVSVAEKIAGFNGGAAGVVRDRNFRIAGTEECFLTEVSDQSIGIQQLAPLMKLDLAVLAPSTRFALLAYLSFVMYNPKRTVKFTNVGIA
jgi:hypothetical protein